MERCDRGEDSLSIPCIVFFEILYLVEKSRVSVGFVDVLHSVAGSLNFRVEPLCVPIIEACQRIPREAVKDPWDRIIAATAMHLGHPLITRDENLKDLGIETIW